MGDFHVLTAKERQGRKVQFSGSTQSSSNNPSNFTKDSMSNVTSVFTP